MFINCCKVCGVSPDDNLVFFPLFNRQIGTELLTKYGSMFVNCLFGDLLPNTSYPEFICEPCQFKLCDFNEFRQIALETHKRFTKILEKDEFFNEPSQHLTVEGDLISQEPVLPTDISILLKEEYLEDEVESGDGNNDINIGKYHEMDSSDAQEGYGCHLCKLVFKLKKELEKHRKTEHNTCKICNREFIRARYLEYHLARHHKPPEPQSFVCKVCGKEFPKASTLRDHEFRHTNLRPIECKFCDKRFKVASDLIVHMRVHNGVRKHICTICGNGFRLQSHLTNHIESHAIERLYECDVCQQKCRTKLSLRRHIKVRHLNFGKYMCLYCQAVFGNKYRLMRHINIHVKRGAIDGDKVEQYAKIQITKSLIC